ncbi:iron ABC transporter permease [Agromyces atrinae]|uniref:ABC transporter permease n=1 Tax=Agromyces atrinae TaxID=592376 RepID=UPI001F5861D5|nr:iron ABC transporter permease [Agromyces atrinae]MCI2957010.1 iron ABC transporter permease [Agromyces atrinae]
MRVGGAGLDGIVAVLTRPRLVELLTNSVMLVVAVCATTALVGVSSALALARVRLPIAGVVTTLCVLPLAMPSYLAAYGWIAAFPGLHGFGAAWLVLSAVTVPLVTLPVLDVLRSSAGDLVDVARTLGHGPVTVFTRVVWPEIRGAVSAGSVLVSLYVLADFGGVSLFRFPVLTTAIKQAYGASFDRNYAAVLAAVLVVVAIALFVLLRSTGRRVSPARGRPGAGARRRAGRATPILLVVVLAAPIVAVMVPLASLLVRVATAETLRPLDVGRLVEAIAGTVALAAGGALLAVILAVPVALLTARYRGRLVAALDTMAALPLAIPGIVVGLGLVFLALAVARDLYQTAGLLVFAYAVLFLPKAISAARTGIERVPRDLDDVAATLGHGRARRLWSITLRLTRPALLLAGLLVAVSAMKELPATLMLRPTGMHTLATELWARTDVSAYGAAAPYALALVVLAAIPSFLLSPAGDDAMKRKSGRRA